MHVQMRGELLGGDAAVPGEKFADCRHAGVEPVHVGVDLDPVAGGHDENLGHRFGLEHVAEQLTEGVTAERGPLKQGDRGALVAEADNQHAHLSTAA